MKKLLARSLALACCLAFLCGCGGLLGRDRYLEINGEEVPRPSWEDVAEGIRGLDDGEDSYVYLELSDALDGVWYLSAALPLREYEDGLGYIVEACAGEEGAYRYYEARTTDAETVSAWFEDFFRGRGAPDLTGWEDITDWYDDYDYGYGYGYDYGYGDDSPYGYDAPYRDDMGAVPI